MAVTTDDVRINLLLNEQAALEGMARLVAATDDVYEKINIIQNQATKFGDKYAIGTEKAIAALKALSVQQESVVSKGIQPEVMLPPSALMSQVSVNYAVQQKELNQIVASVKQRVALEQQVDVALSKGSQELMKQNSYEATRVGQLQKVVSLRQQEIMAIKGVGSYTQQVVNAQKLIASIANQSGSNFQQVAEVLKKDFGYSADVASQAIVNLGNKTKGLSGILNDTIGNVKSWATTLFGIFTAMFAFQLIQLVQNFFTTISEEAKKFKDSVQSLNLAESLLSKYGVETNIKFLEDAIDRLSKKFTAVSKVDARKAFADVARALAVLGLGEKSERVTELALLIKLKKPDKEIAQIQDAITSAMFGGSTKTLEDYGVAITEQSLMALAKRHGIVSETTKALDSQQKALAVVLALEEQIGAQEEDLLAMQDGMAFATERSAAAWDDIGASFGAAFLPMKAELAGWTGEVAANWAGVIEIIKNSILGATALFSAWFEIVVSKYRALFEILSMGFADLFNKENQYTDEIKSRLDGLFDPGSFDLLGKANEKINEYMKLIQSTSDTPTGNLIPTLGDQAEDAEKKLEKLQDTLLDLASDMDEFGDKAREMKYDFETEAKRDFEDYQHDLATLNNETNDKLAEENQKARNRELEAEAKFQEKLRQLREKFLFNLEDALRERDARQVIRLTKQYEMDKQALINEEALRKEAAAREDAERAAKIKKDAADKEAELTYQYELEKRRKEENYRHEMQVLQDQIQDRLREVADALAKELELNQQGADAIYQILMSYFGPNGSIDQLTSYTYESAVAKAQAALDAINSIAAAGEQAAAAIGGHSAGGRAAPSFSGVANSVQNAANSLANWGGFGGGGGRVHVNGGGRAAGGMIVSNTPTDVTFGEAGKEAAIFTPFEKLGNMMGMSPAAKSLAMGRLDVQVTLSPELKSEIINKTLGEVANVMDVVQRGG